MLNILTMRPKTVYLSFIKQDYFYARQIWKALREAGYRVHCTPLTSPNNTRSAACDTFIKQADAVISVVSPTSARSGQIWQDMSQARLCDRAVLPLLVHSFDDGAPFPNAISAVDDIKQGCRTLLSELQQAQLYTDNTIQPSRGVVFLRGLLIAAVLALVLLAGVMYIF
jgi:hypothetical protein